MGKNTGRSVAAGAAVAGAIGFVLGVLFAPKSGKETRQDIKKAASTAKAEAEKKLKKVHSELTELLSEAKKRYESGSATVKKDIEDLMKKAKASQEKVRDILSALHEGTADDPELKAALKEAESAKEHLKSYLQKKS